MIALRKDGVLNFLLLYHLGSTSLVTSDTGALITKTRCKAWGEVRYAKDNVSLPIPYIFTGQRSYMNDIITGLGGAGFGLIFYNARWYDPYNTHFSSPDTLIPDNYNPQDWDRYAYSRNNPIRYNDPSGHKVSCEIGEDCKQTQRLSRLSGADYWKALIKADFGITMSDGGNKKWTEDNAQLMYSSLGNINAKLNGKLKSLVSGAVFKMGNYVATPENCSAPGLTCQYSGLTEGTTITFSTIGNAAIRQMNIYHEFGHLLDNSSGMVNEFSDALGALENPSFILTNGDLAHQIDPAALKSGSVYDPNYGTAAALQHPSTDPVEQWADIFANYVAGNIKLSSIQGAGMNSFITGVLP